MLLERDPIAGSGLQKSWAGGGPGVRRPGVAAVLIASTALGCGSLLSRSLAEGPCTGMTYMGVRQSAKLIGGEEESTAVRLLWVLDFPATVIADTLLLPVDLLSDSRMRERCNPPMPQAPARE
jgi:uncharacterized protein YceK